MDNNKFQWKRPELSLKEVTEQYYCNVDQILHEAAIGKLTIYVKAENWKVGGICSINQLLPRMLQANISGTKFRPNEKEMEALFPEFEDIKDIKDDEEFYANVAEKKDIAIKRLSDRIMNDFPTDGFQEIISNGVMTFYPDNGKYRMLYNDALIGFKPISTFTVALYRNGLDIGVWLNSDDRYCLPDSSTDEFCILPDPLIDFKDALDDGKLFVMKDDLTRLMSNESIDPDNAKGKEDVSRKTLLKLVLGMAMNRYDYDPDKQRTDVAKTIEIGLGPLGIDLTDETILKALREAVLKYPPESTLKPTHPRKPA